MFFVCSCHSFPFVVPFFFLTNRHHGRNGKRGWRGGADGRTHQIVSEVLQKRKIDTGADHAKLQLARLERVMHFAAEALARGDLSVGALYLKTLDRLDRYQKSAGAAEGYNDEDRVKLLAKLSRISERLGYDKILAENKKILAEHEANRERFPGESGAPQ